ncbi:unnamed protein product [Hymenolepis diminuta]|uniref:protein-tyrosine-phosphatase n=1 Tax=Hymenolepis diminuta TaxID=6216 RepID=A0A0R3SA86_HYMDI|nr:unnamed protein product [Hymenolepis diminuta]VUZ46660.1 unnamed protein product [Hymenolepis diminuta]
MDGEFMEISGQEDADCEDSEPINEKKFAIVPMEYSFTIISEKNTSLFDDTTSLDEVEFSQRDFPLSKTEDKEFRSTLMRCSTAPLPSSTSTDSSTHPSMLPICKTSDHGCKMISVHTVAQLVRGEYEMSGIAYHLIDCRYPYEYEPGHIRTALNIYICNHLLEVIFTVVPVVSPYDEACFLDLGSHIQALLRGENKNDTKLEEIPIVPSALPAQVIIFYCEFSSQRGPESGLFLRNVDRYLNCSRYPFLFYPHVYVMMDGYEAFYNEYPELCEPQGYQKMFQLEIADHLFYYSKLTTEVSRVCTACLNNLELYNIPFSPSVEEEVKEEESKPDLRSVKSAPPELFERNTECIIKQSPERNGIIKQCLQLLEHIIQKGKLAAEHFERQNGHILRHPEASSVRLIRKGIMRTSSVSMESDTSTQADSNDFENENRPMGLLNFSGVGEETPFTSRDDSME